MDGTHRHKHRQQRNKTPWRALNAEIIRWNTPFFITGHDIFTPFLKVFFKLCKDNVLQLETMSKQLLALSYQIKSSYWNSNKMYVLSFFSTLDQERSTWIRSVVHQYFYWDTSTVCLLHFNMIYCCMPGCSQWGISLYFEGNTQATHGMYQTSIQDSTLNIQFAPHEYQWGRFGKLWLG